ncbi:MAG: ADP-ribosylation factor-like protein [Candidatus Odinarchaeota archaeon]
MLPVRAKSRAINTYPLTSIALAGLANAGKTSILKKLITGTFNDSDPEMTLGINVEILHRKFDGYVKKFRFFDMSGHHSFRILWSRYLSISHALVYVVDLSDLTNLPLALDVFKSFVTCLKEDVKVLFLGNKQDLIPDDRLEEAVALFKLDNLDSDRGRQIKLFLISVKTGYNFEKAFNWLMNDFQAH